MGCRTGFYLLLAGELSSEAILPLVTGCFKFIAEYEGEIPGASAKDCGNYLDLNLPMAKFWAKRYYELLRTIPEDRLVYPESKSNHPIRRGGALTRPGILFCKIPSPQGEKMYSSFGKSEILRISAGGSMPRPYSIELRGDSK